MLSYHQLIQEVHKKTHAVAPKRQGSIAEESAAQS